MDGHAGEDTLPPPLAGVKVVDLSHFMVAPLPTMMMADMGAEVIKIEPPGRGEGMRRVGNVFLGGETPFFLSLNRGKKSVTLDLRQPKGREIFFALAKTADLVVENFRPGTVEQLGIDYEAVAAINPRVIYCSASAFGQSGPYRDKPGIDAVVQAMAGLMSFNGEPDRPPALIGPPIVDFAGAMMTLQAILFALIARDRYGIGQKVETCLFNAALYAMMPREQDYFATGKPLERLGSAHRNIAPYQAYATSDGYIFLAVFDEANWRRFCRLIGHEELTADPRFRTNPERVVNRAALNAIIEPVMLEKTTAEWARLLDEGDVLGGPVHDLDAVFANPQISANEMLLTMEHPTAGLIKQLGVPIKLTRTPGRLSTPPPLLGQHTDEVLGGLGYTPKDIARLRAEGVV